MQSEFTTPKATKLLINATKDIGNSTVIAQALAGMIAAGWPDPMPEHIASAIFMGCSYVMNLGRMAFESGTLSAEENAAVQGVSELAMQVWKNIYRQMSTEE